MAPNHANPGLDHFRTKVKFRSFIQDRSSELLAELHIVYLLILVKTWAHSHIMLTCGGCDGLHKTGACRAATFCRKMMSTALFEMYTDSESG